MQVQNKKIKKTSSTYDNEDEKNEETVNSRDGSDSICECGKISTNQRKNKNEQRRILSRKYPWILKKISELVPTCYTVRTGASELENRYKLMYTNDMNFNCANISDKNISARTKEKKSGNKDDEYNNSGFHPKMSTSLSFSCT